MRCGKARSTRPSSAVPERGRLRVSSWVPPRSACPTGYPRAAPARPASEARPSAVDPRRARRGRHDVRHRARVRRGGGAAGTGAGRRGQVWTKVGADPVGSIEASLARLRRPRVELRLVAQLDGVRSPAIPRSASAWAALRARPAIASLGATTYGEDDAAAAVESGLFDVVQVEWNLLRQGVLRRLRAPRSRCASRCAASGCRACSRRAGACPAGLPARPRAEPWSGERAGRASGAWISRRWRCAPPSISRVSITS